MLLGLECETIVRTSLVKLRGKRLSFGFLETGMSCSGVEVNTLMRPKDRANDRSDSCVESGMKLREVIEMHYMVRRLENDRICKT